MKTITREEAIKAILGTGKVSGITWKQYQEALRLTDSWEIHDFWKNVCSYECPGWKGELKEPVVIPEDYGEGKTVELKDGRILTSYYSEHQENKRGRLISMEINNFPGHPHYYSDIQAGYLQWKGEDGHTAGGYISTKSGEKAPNLPDLRWEIHRIVPAEEVLTQVHLWDQFDRDVIESGETVWSTRFLSRVELIFTGIFICLARIAGPFRFYLGSYWTEDESKLLCKVDDSDKVFIAEWIGQKFSI